VTHFESVRDDETVPDRTESRPRDQQIARRVGRRILGLGLLFTALGALAGLGAGFLIWGFGRVETWVMAIVLGYTGLILGAMEGGIGGAMDEGRKEPFVVDELQHRSRHHTGHPARAA